METYLKKRWKRKNEKSYSRVKIGTNEHNINRVFEKLKNRNTFAGCSYIYVYLDNIEDK